MKTLFVSILGLSLLASCANKDQDTSSSVDSGAVTTQPEPATEDTAIADSGTTEPASEDTSLEDTAQEDTAIVDSGTTEPATEDTAQSIMMPDFSLPDVNPYSASYGATITVRDQLQSISGWYFIKAT